MFSIIMVLIGGGAILFGVMTRKQQNALRQACTAQAAGVVTRVDKQVRTETYEVSEDELDDREDKDNRTRTREVTTYYPVFKYTAGGRVIEKTGSTGTGTPKYQTGQQVSIFYNPNKPEEFYLGGDTSGNMLATILMIAGVAIILVGLALLFL